MTKHVTQKEFAKKLGVTRVTVSKALNDYPDTSGSMRRKAKEVATEVGHVVDHDVRSLQMRKTNAVGVVIPEVSNVSRALSDHPNVRQSTKDRIHKITKEIQYSPNPIA
jgi:DNA-binding LacI/PurR family transcriptional regulator